MSCQHGIPDTHACSPCFTARLTEAGRLREALRPFALAFGEVLASGRHADLAGLEPVRIVHLRDAFLALEGDR
jgi:hypothetical protein